MTPEVQYGISFEADFDAKTWTFQMPNNYKVWAGTFAIIPKELLAAKDAQISDLENRLKELSDTANDLMKNE